MEAYRVLSVIAAGRFDRWQELRTENPKIRAFRKNGARVSTIAHTEVGRVDSLADQEAIFGGPEWTYVRPNVKGIISEEDTAIEVLDEEWEVLEMGTYELSKLVYYHSKAYGGKPYDPFHLTFLVARHRKTGVIVVKAASHLPTQAATAWRRTVWIDCGRGWVRFANLYRQKYPGCFFELLADTNAGWKRKDHRALLVKHYGAPSGMTFSWASGGIGVLAGKSKRTLIDMVLTDLPVEDTDFIGGTWKFTDGPHTPIWVSYILTVGMKSRTPARVTPKPKPNPKAGWRYPTAPVRYPWAVRSRLWKRRHSKLWRAIVAWRKKNPRRR